MTPNGYAILGLTAVVAALSAVLTFAVLRIFAAARATGRDAHGTGGDATLLSAALAEAVARLKEQERATAARAEASERLSEEIIASLASGLLVVERNGSVRKINPAARRLLNLGTTALTADYRTAIGEPALSGTIDECLSTGKPIVRRSVHLPEPRHGVSRFGVTVSPLSDERGAPHGAVCLFTDLTDVQQLEEQLRLKESLATVGELTAGIAHEFRNGLATIHGYSKLLDPAALPPACRPYVDGIRQEAISLGEVVTNFLNFARPTHLTLGTVSLRSLCERAADDVRSDAALLGGDVGLRGDYGDMQGDDVLLRQAFSNLLRNALEACGGETITPHIIVEGSVDRTRGTCTIVVDDNGPGIPAASRDKVFQPFFTTRRNGTGLGLALVQKIVVSHNGRVTVGASPSGGARLQVVLPLS